MASGFYTLIMVRHGESVYNKENRFCGWYDADLSDTGVQEAKCAGEKIKEKCLKFDVAYTSLLKRAIKTLYYIQEANDLHWVPVIRSWTLNERMYGALQGLDKAETASKYGEDQVKIWRRSYDTPPPSIDEKDPQYPGKDPKYKSLQASQIPKTEALKDTVARAVPFFECEIVPQLKKCQVVLVAAHGNSIRAMCKHLDKISDKDIMELNIPTGIPLVYELDADLKPVKHYYLASDEEVKAAIDKVAAQGKAQK